MYVILTFLPNLLFKISIVIDVKKLPTNIISGTVAKDVAGIFKDSCK